MRVWGRIGIFAILLSRGLPVFASDVITNVMSTIVSYQSAQNLDSEVLSSGRILSGFVSFQFPSDVAGDLLTRGGIESAWVSYQFPEDVSGGTLVSGRFTSRTASYQFPENLGVDILIRGSVVSRFASYQYFEWPGNGILQLATGPILSYFWQYGSGSGQLALHGRVTDLNGVGLSGAMVKALVFLTPVAQTTTDASGYYQMSSLSSGVYDLWAMAPTYQTLIRALTLGGGTAGLWITETPILRVSPLPTAVTRISLARDLLP
jgi:hypothetical protein